MVDSTVEYKYYVVNIVTNQVLGELPLTGVSYDRALKDAGSLSGTIALSQETEGIDVYSATMPGKNAIYVTRNGVCVWGGPIWSRSYDVVAKTVSINANEFTSYYQHRKIWKTWNLTHSGCLVYVDPDDTTQLIVELNSDTKDTIDIEEGVAVELAFTDKKGYNLNGHFRVNDTFYNATKITVDKEALQWNVFGVDHIFQEKGDTIAIDKREVTAGSPEVIITTATPHSLATGDEVFISGLESNVGKSFYNTYKTLPKEYPIAALASTSVIYRYGQATQGNFEISNINTTGISVGANISTLQQKGKDSGKVGSIATEGFKATVTEIITKSTGVSRNGKIKFSSYTASSSTNTPSVRTGPVYLKFENKKSGYSFSYKNPYATYTIQPKTYDWKNKIKAGETLLQLNGMPTGDPFFGVLPTNQVTYTAVGGVTNGNSTITVSSTKGIAPGDIIEKLTGTGAISDTVVSEVLNSTQFTVEKAPTTTGTLSLAVISPKYHKVTAIIGPLGGVKGTSQGVQTDQTDFPGVPTLQFKRDVGNIPYSLAGYQKPAVDGSFNIVAVTEHELPDTRSRAAVCASDKKLPVIKVIDRKTFVVNGGCDAKYDNTNNNPGGTIEWDGKYQATMYTHTDTYEQVRYFLGKVHEDFVTVENVNPFLGKLEKYQIRTASYDSATDLATITTGFRRSIFSKKIYFDYSTKKIKAKVTLYNAYSQFDTSSDVGEILKITGQDESINGSHYITEINSSTVLNSPPKSVIYFDLDASEQDAVSYDLSSASGDGTYVTYTTQSAHNIRVGQLITVGGISTNLNCENALVVEVPSSTQVKIAKAVSETNNIPYSAIYTSDRLTQEVRLVPDTSIATFGAHGLSAGNNFELVGLSRENYDGVWKVSSVIDDVTFTYKPAFEELKITNYKLEYVGGSYLVTVKLSKKPYFKKYAYIPKYTNITISGLGEPYDGPFTLNEYKSEKLSNGTESHYFTYKITGSSGSRQVHPFRGIDYSQRKYGTSYVITAASYVAQTSPRKTGKGTTTYTTSAAHGFQVGDKVVVSNIGGSFTQKTGNANAYSEYVVTVSTAGSTTFTANNITSTNSTNHTLYKIKFNQDTDSEPGTANRSASPGVGGGASATLWDSSTTRPSDVYASVKIDNLPSVTSTSILTTNVTGRAFNPKTKEVFLKVSSDPGFIVGGKVVVEDVDDYRNSVFDGTYTITSFKKVNNSYQIGYFSINKTYKTKIGKFDSENNLVSYDSLKEPGTASVDAAVYVGSYGSFTENSDIGLEFSTYENSGNYQRVPSYRGHELKNVGEYLSEYSDKYIVKPGSTKIVRNVHGFEYRIDCEYDEVNKSFRRIFKFLPINYPNPPVHGEVSPPSRFGADKFVFEYPGNISNVSLEESAEEASTRFFMVGSDGGTGTSEASKSYVGVAHTELFADNWPTLDSSESNDKLDFISDITENAYRYLNETKPPSGVFQISVVGNLDPIVNTYQPGDWCSIIVNDKFVRDRLASDLEPRDDVIVRKIVSYSVSVPDAPSVPESVTMNLITEWDVDKRG